MRTLDINVRFCTTCTGIFFPIAVIVVRELEWSELLIHLIHYFSIF